MSTHILGSSHLKDAVVRYRRLPTPNKVTIWVGISLVLIFLIHSGRVPPHFRGGPPPPGRPPPHHHHRPPPLHDPSSPQEKALWKERKAVVREAFQHAYAGYELHAFGKDELKPLSNNSVNNLNGWGLTIVDSLDTIIMLDLDPEVDRAMKFIQTLDFTKPPEAVGFFETMIRYVGGFLSAYYLTSTSTNAHYRDTYAPILLKKAEELSEVLNGAFNTTSGLPDRWVKVNDGKGQPSNPHGGGSLAEMATCQMEWKYLSHLTDDPTWFKNSQHVMDVMERTQGKTPARRAVTAKDGTTNEELSTEMRTGLWLNQFGLEDGQMFGVSVSAGAMGDSAYEYLLKQYLLSGRTEKHILDMYLKAMDGVINHLLYLSPKNNLLYMTELGQWATPNGIFEHLSCYMPGVLALGAQLLDPDYPWDGYSSPSPPHAKRFAYPPGTTFKSFSDGANATDYVPPYPSRLRARAPVHPSSDDKEELRRTLDLHMRTAKGLAHTCWTLYASTASGIGPESVSFHMPDPPADHGAAGAPWLSRDRYNPVQWAPKVAAWERGGRRGPLVGTEEGKGKAKGWGIGTGGVGAGAEAEWHAGLIPPEEQDWNLRDQRYLLRPEAIEAMYLLWKTTGERKWRERGWRMFDAVNRHTRAENGYASVQYVQNEKPMQVDDMPSFFLAETLKYVYLLTVEPEDDPLPLDKIVFNTEAHPLPVFEWTAQERARYNIH